MARGTLFGLDRLSSFLATTSLAALLVFPDAAAAQTEAGALRDGHAAVDRVEVHRHVGRVLDAGGEAAEAADVGHASNYSKGAWFSATDTIGLASAVPQNRQLGATPRADG